MPNASRDANPAGWLIVFALVAFGLCVALVGLGSIASWIGTVFAVIANVINGS